MFASAKRLDGGNGWRWRLEQLKKRLFGKKHGYDTEVLPMAYYDDARYRDSLTVKSHSRNPVTPNRLEKLRDVEDKSSTRHTADSDLDSFIGEYEHSIRTSIDDRYNPRRIERDSLYSQATGNQRFTPEPRQPLRRDAYGTSKLMKTPVLIDLETSEERGAHTSTGGVATEAQAYAMSVRPGLITVGGSIQPAMPSSFIRTTSPIVLTPTPPQTGGMPGQGPYWISPVVNAHSVVQPFHFLDDPMDAVVLEPMNTGGSSRNPFRQ